LHTKNLNHRVSNFVCVFASSNAAVEELRHTSEPF
jgi:hypothetical protein